MLMPSKHIRLSESIFGLAAFLLQILAAPKNLDNLWAEFCKINNTRTLPAYHSFDNYVLALDFLFSVGLIEQTTSGEVQRASN